MCQLLSDRTLFRRIGREERIAMRGADDKSRRTSPRRSFRPSGPRRSSRTSRRRWPACASRTVGAGYAAKLRRAPRELRAVASRLVAPRVGGLSWLAISTERSGSSNPVGPRPPSARACTAAARRCAAAFSALAVPGVTSTTAALVLADERRRNRLEATWSRTNDLDPLGLARPSLGGKYRDDRDAVHLEICLDSKDLTDSTVVRDHRPFDHPAGLQGPSRAPGPTAIFTGGGELDIHTTSHCGGEASSLIDQERRRSAKSLRSKSDLTVRKRAAAPSGGPSAVMGGMGYRQMAGFRRDRSIMQHQLQKGLIKRIYGFSAPYRKVLVLFMVLVIVDAAASTANPLIYRVILNDGIVRHHAALIIWLAILLAGLAVLDAVLGIAERMISARVGGGLVLDMRSQVFGHVSRMPIAFFTRAQTGALVSRLNNDVQGAQQAFTDILSNVVSNLVTVALVLAGMFYLSWQITLVALCILPVFIFPAKRVGKRLQVITRESYGLNAEMTTMMTERFNVAGALLVKIFGRLDAERANFDQRASRVRDIGISQAMLARIFFGALMLTAALATAVVYGWGGLLAERGSLSVGTVVALASYLTRLYGPLTQLSNVQLDVMTALVSFDRVFEVLDLEPMIDERENADPARSGARSRSPSRT